MSEHKPFTSEPSNPHTSKAEPAEHVDVHHFGEGGKKDESLTVPHVTDKGMVDLGKQAQELRDAKKDEGEDKKE